LAGGVNKAEADFRIISLVLSWQYPLTFKVSGPIGKAGEVRNFAQRALIAASISLGLLLLILMVYNGLPVFFLIFGGILIGSFFRGAAGLLQRWLGLGRIPALVLGTLLLLGGLMGGFWFVGSSVVAQAQEFVTLLPEAANSVRDKLLQYSWGQTLLQQLPDPSKLMSSPGSISGRLTGTASGILGGLFNLLILLVVGLYFTFQPEPYTRGIITLVPPAHRDRARQVLSALDETLQRWLLARMISMVALGSTTALGLWLLGVKLPLPLGFLAGVLNFIPNVGPALSVIPALLLALVDGPQQALYVAALYGGLQLLDNFVVSPLVDRYSVSIPPVLSITAQLLMGLLVGLMGVIVASPLVAVALVLVRMLYVEDVLQDRVSSSQPD
jgi:predicted PurR-regulated permease PerM